MSGDCDLCGSYDHVETSCDAYDCRTCEDEGIVAVGFGLDSTEPPRIAPCPDCAPKRSDPVDPAALWGEHDRRAEGK